MKTKDVQVENDLSLPFRHGEGKQAGSPPMSPFPGAWIGREFEQALSLPLPACGRMAVPVILPFFLPPQIAPRPAAPVPRPSQPNRNGRLPAPVLYQNGTNPAGNLPTSWGGAENGNNFFSCSYNDLQALNAPPGLEPAHMARRLHEQPTAGRDTRGCRWCFVPYRRFFGSSPLRRQILRSRSACMTAIRFCAPKGSRRRSVC